MLEATAEQLYDRTHADKLGFDFCHVWDGQKPHIVNHVDCSADLYLVILQCNFNEFTSSLSTCTDNDDVSVVCSECMHACMDLYYCYVALGDRCRNDPCIFLLIV